MVSQWLFLIGIKPKLLKYLIVAWDLKFSFNRNNRPCFMSRACGMEFQYCKKQLFGPLLQAGTRCRDMKSNVESNLKPKQTNKQTKTIIRSISVTLVLILVILFNCVYLYRYGQYYLKPVINSKRMSE